MYFMNEPRITLIISPKGRVNFVGAQRIMDINKALKKIYPILFNYKIIEENNKTINNFSNINNSG